MVQEREYSIPGGSLYYEVIEALGSRKGIGMTQLQELAGEVAIPGQLDG